MADAVAESWRAGEDRWQSVRNAMPIPARRLQRTLPDPVHVHAHFTWERDGDETISALAIAWTRDRVLVIVDDPRLRIRGMWLAPHDVRRTWAQDQATSRDRRRDNSPASHRLVRSPCRTAWIPCHSSHERWPTMSMQALLECIDPGVEDLVGADGSRCSPSLQMTYWLDKAGDFHRDDDEPAQIRADGTLAWMRHGVLHRDHGRPAVIRRRPSVIWPVVPLGDGFPASTKAGVIRGRPGGSASSQALESQILGEWRVNGVLTRSGGQPARIWADGVVEFWELSPDGRTSYRHRDGGLPAVVYPRPYWRAGHESGPDEWWVRGRRHSADGAAQLRFSLSRHLPSESGRYWLEGVRVSQERWSVLRHYPTDQPFGLHPENTAAWVWLDRAGAINHERETIGTEALALALAMFPNPS